MAGYIALFVVGLLFFAGLAYIFRLLLKANKKVVPEGDPLLGQLEVKAAERNLTSGKVLGIALYAVSFLALVWLMFYHEPASKYQITASDIYTEFTNNKEQAIAKYRDQFVTVTGKYVGDERVYGSPAVLLQTSANTASVQCNFEGGRAEQVKHLSLGEEVSLKGKVLGKTKNVVIEKCSVAKRIK